MDELQRRVSVAVNIVSAIQRANQDQFEVLANTPEYQQYIYWDRLVSFNQLQGTLTEGTIIGYLQAVKELGEITVFSGLFPEMPPDLTKP